MTCAVIDGDDDDDNDDNDDDYDAYPLLSTALWQCASILA